MSLAVRTPLVQVVGAIAYGELKAYDEARSGAATTADPAARRELRTIAAEELRHHKGFIRMLERWGADPDRAMRPYRAALDHYHGATARSDLEAAVWDHLGEGIADDLLSWLRTVLADDADAVEFLDSVIADEVAHEARATRELRALLDATPGGRRQAAAAARRMVLLMLRSGGNAALPMLAFLRLGRQPQLLATLLAGIDRRLRAVGVGPLDLALPLAA